MSEAALQTPGGRIAPSSVTSPNASADGMASFTPKDARSALDKGIVRAVDAAKKHQMSSTAAGNFIKGLYKTYDSFMKNQPGGSSATSWPKEATSVWDKQIVRIVDAAKNHRISSAAARNFIESTNNTVSHYVKAASTRNR